MIDPTAKKTMQIWGFAKQHLVAGVSASTRVNKALGRPFIAVRGQGSRLWGVDGNELIDLCTSHGGSILGHKHPKIVAAIQKALDMGIMCSYETEYQGRLAAKICQMVPAAELCRFTCSGTEATMHAIRLARTITGREKILKFEGHFHGYHDYVQFTWGPDLKALPSPDESPTIAESAGIPKGMNQYCIAAPFNNLNALEKAIDRHKDDLAAVICEPINYNAGCIIPDKEYMRAMRQLCSDNGILLIYDEVLSAFRMGPDCGQGYLGITPDLCTIGKCVAGGTPLSVFAGKKEYMEQVSPLGKSAHSGTYTGHLIPVMAAIACLEEISSPGFYEHINALAEKLYGGMEELLAKYKIQARVQGLGARFGLYFGVDKEVRSYRDAARADKEILMRFLKLTYENGIYFHDYQGHPCHHGFSSAHSLEDMDEVLTRLESVLKKLG
ncbi:MAG: aminotransferase class III-fold pyridoxal phosphate-dependent enzyme [Actinobacteria bacterium]|nr:aminotransferase class III-fold pyridoxal phosphate-dependent enzyme [Actinomycetota bacterium]